MPNVWGVMAMFAVFGYRKPQMREWYWVRLTPGIEPGWVFTQVPDEASDLGQIDVARELCRNLRGLPTNYTLVREPIPKPYR